MGLPRNDPRVDHKCVDSTEAFCATLICSAFQPPASTSPRIGISSAPAQIRMNCSTSLKIAERSPPSVTYTATVIDETQMLKLMSQPRTTFITSAIAYMLMPLISTVMNAHEMAVRARVDSRRRTIKLPGTEFNFLYY